MSTIDVDWFITRKEEVRALENKLYDALDGKPLFRNRKGEVFVGIGEIRKPLQELLDEVDPYHRLSYNLLMQHADPIEYSDDLQQAASEMGIDLNPVFETRISIQLCIGKVCETP